MGLMRTFTLLGALFLAGCAGWPLASKSVLSEPTSCQSTRKIRVILVGDSTVNDQGGWGAGLKPLFDDEVECINYAKNGRSSKSFIEEGHWQRALAAGRTMCSSSLDTTTCRAKGLNARPIPTQPIENG